MEADFLADRILRIDTSQIRKAFDLAARLKNPLNLSIGQPDFPVPEPVKEAMIRAVRDNQNAYSQTQGILPLREKLAQKYSKEFGYEYSPENILVSTGVASILFLLFETLANAGDEVLILEPWFLIYEALASKYQLKLHTLPENFSREDVDELLEKKPNLKFILFATPSNPTGKILSEQQLKELGRLAEATNAILISDEIYRDYDYDEQFVSCAKFFPERTIVLGGFSKSHAMTGWRVGYAIAPKNLNFIIQKMATLQQYSIVCSPTPAQHAAIVALDTPITEELALMKRRREIVKKKLSNKVKFPAPDGAFYVFPDIPVDADEFLQKAVEKSLLLVPGFIFTRNRKTVRISYAQKEEILEEGLDIFLELCELLSK
ncbi:MAG: aminotransferase class I/II-fold pyridoxal phosphate-dependent enzyme [Candidatus Hydrogenedentota bacterium]|nr:MAG: aminotransferase class I/II-fold pyridoxal phosphate-dependent enzyme [Candidatus Hydrogenedentota bacterium]